MDQEMGSIVTTAVSGSVMDGQEPLSGGLLRLNVELIILSLKMRLGPCSAAGASDR